MWGEAAYVRRVMVSDLAIFEGTGLPMVDLRMRRGKGRRWPLEKRARQKKRNQHASGLPEAAACIHRDRDLPTQGRAHARSHGVYRGAVQLPRSPAPPGWSSEQGECVEYRAKVCNSTGWKAACQVRRAGGGAALAAAAVRDMVAGIPAGSGIWAPAVRCAARTAFPLSAIELSGYARAVRSAAGVGMGAVPSAGAREGLGGR